VNDRLSITANLLGDPGRAAILLSLMGGIALPAGELAHIANVAPQTASAHLGRLVDGHLLNVERQGRHRYYRLANSQVAEAIEALLVLTARPRSNEKAGNTSEPAAGSVAYARTCYSHLAGRVGVQIADALEARGLLVRADAKAYAVTSSGIAWFATLGIEIVTARTADPRFARRCLDWTERRHHLAGTLGCAMFRRFRELKWMAPMQDTRAIRLTLQGKSRLWELFHMPIG
jgi:DNA-binding transcriptional ArsR family regulator